MAESIKVAKPIVLFHLQGLWKCVDVKAYQNVTSFFYTYENNLALQEAILTLKLTSYFDNLLDVNETIESHLSGRTQDYSKREKGATVKKVADITASVVDVFKQIELGKVKNQELDYMPLINEMNQEIAETKAKLKSRSSYYKKKADEFLNNNVVDENDEIVVEDESEESSEPTRSTTRMYPMAVEVVNGESSNGLDIIKTVAMNTNHND